MRVISAGGTENFHLLNIGQRAVGKTVFLAGSYAELHTALSTPRPPLWFDCRDSRSREAIEQVLRYITTTGSYPPATMKVGDFDFTLKRRGLLGASTLCHFRFQDVPGEMCRPTDGTFRSMVLASHGCCVYVDGYALVHNAAYLGRFKDILVQGLSIASLARLNGAKYATAVVVTKCDLLSEAEQTGRLERALEPLTERLGSLEANYRVFYSSIPLVREGERVQLRPSGGAAPLLWLALELNRLHNPGLTGLLMQWKHRLWPSRWQGEAPNAGPLQGIIRTPWPPGIPVDAMGVTLGQLLFTSFAQSGFRLVTSPEVPETVRRCFMSAVVERRWNEYALPAPGYRSAFLHQGDERQTLFGWVYSDGTDDVGRDSVPYFLGYHLGGWLEVGHLELIFALLRHGPTDAPNRRAVPPPLEALVPPDLWHDPAARPGVKVPWSVREQAETSLQQGELLDLFVPVDPARLPAEVSAELCGRLEQLLSEHIGPMAGILVRRAVARTAGVVDPERRAWEIYRDLAGEVDDPGAAERFQAEVRRALNLLA